MAYSLAYSYNSTSKSYSVERGVDITASDKVVIPATYNDGTNGEHPVTSISNMAFSECAFLTSIIIPNSITRIHAGAFYYCTALASVHLPNKITIIDEGTFNYCSSLTSVHIPNSVTSIYSAAFSDCTSLTSVTIPDSITSIEANAFYNCPNLAQLILLPSTPPTLSSGAIPTTIQSIYVQQSSKAAYKAAPNWKTFASKIISDDMYLSLAQFNQKNKEYINSRLTLSDIYPVGSIYLSVNSTSPASLFGGVWEQIKDRFLLAAGDTYSAGLTGGEANHTLTVDEMPNHQHGLFTDMDGYGGVSLTGNYIKMKGNETVNGYVTQTGVIYNGWKGMSGVGNNQPHNNMPPYLAVYMWKRTS